MDIEELYRALLNIQEVTAHDASLSGIFSRAKNALEDLTPEERSIAGLTGQLAHE